MGQAKIKLITASLEEKWILDFPQQLHFRKQNRLEKKEVESGPTKVALPAIYWSPRTPSLLTSFNSGKKHWVKKKKNKKGGIPEPDGAVCARVCVCVCVLTLGHGQATHTQTAVYSWAITSPLRHVLIQNHNSCSTAITDSETTEIHSVTRTLCDTSHVTHAFPLKFTKFTFTMPFSAVTIIKFQ